MNPIVKVAESDSIVVDRVDVEGGYIYITKAYERKTIRVHGELDWEYHLIAVDSIFVKNDPKKEENNGIS